MVGAQNDSAGAGAVRELCAGKEFLFADRVLRGFEDPVRVFEISSRE